VIGKRNDKTHEERKKRLRNMKDGEQKKRYEEFY